MPCFSMKVGIGISAFKLHALHSLKVGIGIVRSIWLPILWNSVIYNERFACGEGCKANGEGST